MVNYNELVKLYKELAEMSSYVRLQNASSAYEQMERLLQQSMGHGAGYFAATNVACAFLAADGQLTSKEHEMFRTFATSSCTYDELHQLVARVSKDFRKALHPVLSGSEPLRWTAGYLAAAIFAEKGVFGGNEDAIFRILEGSF